MCSNTEGSSVVSVPGKALLFGEYGVMNGGHAVAVCLPQFRMGVEFAFKPARSQPVHILESEFFPSAIQVKQSQIQTLLLESGESEERNLASYIAAFEPQISHVSVNAKVVESFSPALGFGTSSALLVAFSVALERQFHKEPGTKKFISPKYWQRLYDGLLRLQGRGSGYDIALQAWLVENMSQRLEIVPLIFKNGNNSLSKPAAGFSPVIEELRIADDEIKKMGCFVGTGVRSNTREVLRKMESRSTLTVFSQKQSELAKRFIERPTFQQAVELCAEASELIQEMELLPVSPSLQRFVEQCDRAGVSWKTMGAGHGDCLWVLANRSTVQGLVHRACADQIQVQFAFEDS
jgi:mevalonate kinase